ncbi:MAG: ATP-binding protein [Methylotenera sp.]|nr:ATP-binding protein [Methylotenera sp.]
MRDQINPVVVNPNVGNLVTSLRDIGYTFEIAVADIVDNCISAGARNVQIIALSEPKNIVCILDDGCGMNEAQLIEAMRLATQNPLLERSIIDLGRFGLGLKTASFSQCKKLTVASKKNHILSNKQWDLDYISTKNEWLLLTPDLASFEHIPLFRSLQGAENGTIVIWEDLDRFQSTSFAHLIDSLRKHLSLVFHRFLEFNGAKKLKISINNFDLEPFNPFNVESIATQQISEEKITVYGETISIQPFILPHHSKISQQEFERYATDEGYTKSQGFYLYRSNRLLIYGTWWGLHKISDAHKLVRIKIDITNTQDSFWGIDIKKSTAKPVGIIRDDLKRIISQVTERGSRPFTGRGRKIEDKTTKRFWDLQPDNEQIKFTLAFDHPVYQELISTLSEHSKELMGIYLKGVQAYLPLEAIQAQLNQNPHLIQQEALMGESDVLRLAEILNGLELDESVISTLMKTEMFKNRKELLERKS